MKENIMINAQRSFRGVLWSLVLIGLLVPQTVMPQEIKCKDMKDRCIRTVEQQYQDCFAACKAADWDVFCLDISDSLKFQECRETNIKSCNQECTKEYQQYNNFCYDAYKQCRKGDVFGKVTMDISYEHDVCSAPYVSGTASFTILGFWKYQPGESNEYVKNYRPNYLHLMGLLTESTMVHNEECPHLTPHRHGCPTLLSHFVGGGGAVLSVSPNVDMPNNPLGRLVLFDFPSKIFKSKHVPQSVRPTPLYRVGHLGEEIRLMGMERPDGDCPPDSRDYSCFCPKYGPAVYKVRFGKFLISADLKSKKEMSGSESWESCGNAIEKTGGTKSFEHEATLSFSIQKDSLSGESDYDPKKKEMGEDCSTMKSKITVQWDFSVIR
jgi:hypothetical protein